MFRRRSTNGGGGGGRGVNNNFVINRRLIHSYLTVVVFLFLGVSFLPSAVVVGQPQNLDYTYDDFDSWSSVGGIGDWSIFGGSTTSSIARFPNQCGDGDDDGFNSRQSPVHLHGITPPRTCPDLHEPLVRQLDPTIDCRRIDMDFTITPYGLRAYMPLNDDTCLRPSLTLSNRIDPYVFLFMELHMRSEHVVEGRRYDGELQFIHAGSGRETGQMMILSLLIDASAEQDNLEMEWMIQQWKDVADNENLQCSSRRHHRRGSEEMTSTDESQSQLQSPILRRNHYDISDYYYDSNNNNNENPTQSDMFAKHHSHHHNQQQQHQERNLQFTPSPCRTDQFGNGCEPLGPRRRMFPYNLWEGVWYYGYSGSLSTPPCTEIVQWRVFDEPIRITRRQYKTLTQLMSQAKDDNCQPTSAASSTTGENYRPIQQEDPLYYHCTNDDFGYFVYEPQNQ